MTLEVDTRRWAGVPFYLRTGKRLGKRVTEIAVVFKRAPHLPFEHTATEELGQNAIVIRVQPDEGVTIRFGSKVPGAQMEVRDVTMDFGYGSSFTEASPEAYERLILDVLLGDPPLFPRHEEVESSWRILDPLMKHWAKGGKPEQYPAGTWGPPSADADARARRTHVEDAVIRDLTDTTTTGISKTLVRLRNEVGAHGPRARADPRRRRRGHRRRQRHRGRQPGEPPAPLPHHRRHRRRPSRQEPARRPDPARR